MRIAIDARLNAYRTGGIPQYTRHLLTALAEIAPDNEFITLQHRDHLRPLAVAQNVVRRAIWTPPHHRLEPWALPLELLPLRAQVLHCPDFIAPIYRPCAAVVTIHDLAFKRFPDILDDSARAYYNQVGRSSARADGIIAVSEATRHDIAQFLDIAPHQIDVVHEAAAPLFRRMDLRPGEVRVLRNQPVEVGTFMLFVSTLEPRKNLPTLLKALRVCIDRAPERGYMLVVAGGRGWRDEAIFQAVRDLRLGDYVLFAGNVGPYDLRWLYNACRFYVNPSLYEGFGLPLLEAMACGAACIAADTSSLPEIGGEAALYLPPLDVERWADSIEQLWGDEEQRRDMAMLSLARARRFSWQRAARETLHVYQRALERRASPARQLAPQPVAASEADQAPPFDATAPRTCLRCGTQLVAGEPQAVAVRMPDTSPNPPPLGAWACPTCGRVELVLPEYAPATGAESPAQVPALPLEEPTAAFVDGTTPPVTTSNDGADATQEAGPPAADAASAELPDDHLAAVAPAEPSDDHLAAVAAVPAEVATDEPADEQATFAVSTASDGSPQTTDETLAPEAPEAPEPVQSDDGTITAHPNGTHHGLNDEVVAIKTANNTDGHQHNGPAASSKPVSKGKTPRTRRKR